MKYLDKYAISEEKLRQQFVDWTRVEFTIDKYDDFLDARACRLASEANNYLLTLSKSLPESCRPNLATAAGNKNGTGKQVGE
jgi:hypothetical protein